MSSEHADVLIIMIMLYRVTALKKRAALSKVAVNKRVVVRCLSCLAGSWRRRFMDMCITGLNPQRLQLQAQVTLASLG